MQAFSHGGWGKRALLSRTAIFGSSRWASSLLITIYIAVAKLLVHLPTNGHYGYFRDELYYLARGDHLDWGYVDQAPLGPWIARVVRTLLGDSLPALRFLPAVAGAGKILLTGLIARELGGRRFAVTLACLSVLTAPIYLGIDTLFSVNVFEPLFWMGSAYAVVVAIHRNDPRYRVWVGLCAGLGLETKHSMLFFGFGIIAGLAMTPARRLFADRWLWLAGAIAFALFLPNLIWQYQHDWATLEVLRNVQATGKNVVLSPWAYIAEQIFLLLPVTILVWGAGLWYFLFDRVGSRYRALGVAYLVTLGLMIVLKGKSYYLAPAYPMLFAGGGVVWEAVLEQRPGWRWLRIGLPVLLVLGGAAAAPFALPLLPIETYLRYQHVLGIRPPKTEVAHTGPLPQLFSDMYGWPEMVAAAARAYWALPSEERARAAILTRNYGEAGAIDLFGPRYGLPKAISAHQNYYLWGPRDYTGDIMIVLGWPRTAIEQHCNSLEEAGRVDHPYAVAQEHFTLFVCRRLRQPLWELWPQWKRWT